MTLKIHKAENIQPPGQWLLHEDEKVPLLTECGRFIPMSRCRTRFRGVTCKVCLAHRPGV